MTAVTDFSPVLLKPEDAAKALAISPRALWRLTAAREIPHVRIGRSVRYDAADLAEYVQGRKIKARG